MKIIVPLLCLFIAVLGCVAPSGQRSNSTSDSNRKGANSRPQLKLLAMKGVIEYSYLTVQGQVENISGERLENVQAVVNHYDADGNFVSSDTALIEYDPLMPGQTSPFRVGTRYNPAMKTFNIEFKHLMGGMIAFDDARPAPKPGKNKKK